MAIVQISQIQLRRGLQQDLPQLASAEMGWSVDTRRLFIGNGTLAEGAPTEGITEILTERSDIMSFLTTYTFKGLSAGYQVVTGPDLLHPVVRSLQDKLDEYVSVKDFGATGDSITDDTQAIQRALDRAFATNQRTLSAGHHRTINFPAGEYKISSTLKIPPYTRLQGEGKRTTIITGNFAGPLAEFADEFGEVGENYGADDLEGNTPATAEYHISDMCFLQQCDTYDQSAVVIDGCWTATFNRVMFRGITAYTQPDVEIGGYGNGTGLDYYTSNRGSNVAGCAILNRSLWQSCRNISFIQCDFMDINYGLQIDEEVVGVTVSTCYFDHSYHSIAIGMHPTNGYSGFGITIFDNYFRFAAAEGLIVGDSYDGVMSLGNMYSRSGLSDWESDSPVDNPDGIARSPVITYGSSGNYSIADSFSRSREDYALFRCVETNGFENYVLAPDVGLQLGAKEIGRGEQLVLDDATEFTSVGATFIRDQYTNLKMYYTLKHSSQQRTGTLTANRIGSTYVFDEEYSETGETGVVLRVNSTTGDIEYTSVTFGDSASLSYNLETFHT